MFSSSQVILNKYTLIEFKADNALYKNGFTVIDLEVNACPIVMWDHRLLDFRTVAQR